MIPKKIVWDQVTSVSQLVAIILFVAIFALGFYIGKTYEYHTFLNSLDALKKGTTAPAVINDVVFGCDGNKSLEAVFFNNRVSLILSDNRTFDLSQVIAASGARYANTDESIVFWNKGDTAFLTEGKTTTYANCTVRPDTKR